jgi:hypothetical protein
VKAAAVPEITPIKTPRATPPVVHITPRLTSKVTTTKTIVDKSKVPAILASIAFSTLFLLCFRAVVVSERAAG